MLENRQDIFASVYLSSELFVLTNCPVTSRNTNSSHWPDISSKNNTSFNAVHIKNVCIFYSLGIPVFQKYC